MRRIGEALALFLFATGPVLAAEDVSGRMDHIAQVSQKENGFTGAVLIVQNGKTVLGKGYGTALNKPRPIGAITEQFTAAAILLLQQDGKLKIDDPLSAYLPETPASWSKITLHHLLSNRSGLAGFEKFPDPKGLLAQKPAPHDLEKQIFDAFPAPEPDKEFKPSSSNYILLGLVIERVSGQPYADFLKKRVFSPLGMKASSLPAQTPDSALTGFLFSAGGIVSTVHDLNLWLQGLYGGKLLSAASLKAMTSGGPDDFYGLGLFILHEEGHPIYGADNAMMDGNSGVAAYRPDEKQVVAALGKTNHDALMDVAIKLGAVARGEKVVLISERVSTAQPNVTVLPEKLVMPGLNRERTLRLYLPPDYADHPDRRYPVIYMHDGQNLFDDKTAYSGEWGVDETLNELAKKTGFEAIVVGIDNGGDKRMSELSPYPTPKLELTPEGPDYMRFIVEVVKRYIDQRYRTLPDRANTAIMGSSMGGLISHYALQAYPQVFSKFGVFSPSYWSSPELVERAAKTPLPPDTRIYLYCGGDEGHGMSDATVAMADSLKGQGPSDAVMLHILPGAIHHEKYWRPEFGPAVEWMFQIGGKDSQDLSHR